MKAARSNPKPSTPKLMAPNKLRDHVVRALEDLKGKEIVALDVSRATSVTDYMVIASGTSNRHVKALVDNLLESSHANGIPSIGVEGRETMEWVLRRSRRRRRARDEEGNSRLLRPGAPLVGSAARRIDGVTATERGRRDENPVCCAWVRACPNGSQRVTRRSPADCRKTMHWFWKKSPRRGGRATCNAASTKRANDCSPDRRDDCVIALDERGSAWSSVVLSQKLAAWRQRWTRRRAAGRWCGRLVGQLHGACGWVMVTVCSYTAACTGACLVAEQIYRAWTLSDRSPVSPGMNAGSNQPT